MRRIAFAIGVLLTCTGADKQATKTTVSLVVSSAHEKDVEKLLATGLLQQAAAEQHLQLVIANDELRKENEELLNDKEGSSARFTTEPQPLIILSNRFFTKPFDAQQYGLLHEMRFAYQHLVSPTWRKHHTQRREMAERFNNTDQNEFQGAWNILGARAKIDAQEYAMSKLPTAGQQLITTKLAETAQIVKKFPGQRAHTKFVCFDLLAELYECRYLAHRIPKKELPNFKGDYETVGAFLYNRTDISKNTELKNAVDAYFTTKEPSAFLEKAEKVLKLLK